MIKLPIKSPVVKKTVKSGHFSSSFLHPIGVTSIGQYFVTSTYPPRYRQVPCATTAHTTAHFTNSLPRQHYPHLLLLDYYWAKQYDELILSIHTTTELVSDSLPIVEPLSRGAYFNPEDRVSES